MSDRMSVTVDKDNQTVHIAVGNVLGIHRNIQINLSSAESIVSGILEAANAGDQMVQAQVAQLAQRVEALEKLMKGEKAAGATS